MTKHEEMVMQKARATLKTVANKLEGEHLELETLAKLQEMLGPALLGEGGGGGAESVEALRRMVVFIRIKSAAAAEHERHARELVAFIDSIFAKEGARAP